MKEKEINLVPLRFIRIAKDLNMAEFSKHFLVTSAYISLVEKGKREMTLRTLKSGLKEMGISYIDYVELEELSEELITKDIDKNLKYRIMLTKAIGVINPSLKEETEQLIDVCYRDKKIKLSNSLVLKKHDLK